MKKISLKEYNHQLKEINKITTKSKLKALEYLNNSAPVKHECEHCNHVFNAIPKVVKRDLGIHCPSCGDRKNTTLSKKDYIDKLHSVNCNIKYVSGYKNTISRCIHKCTVCEHSWKVLPKVLMNGQGCPECYKSNIGNATRYKKQIKKWNLKVKGYTNSYTPAKHLCLTCGYKWKNKPQYILYKLKGCPECKRNSKPSVYKRTKEEYLEEKRLKSAQNFIEKIKEKFGNSINTNKVVDTYRSSKNKVTLLCNEHGEFETIPERYISNTVYPCPKCSYESLAKKYISNKKEFIKKAKKVHGNAYKYSKVKYKNSMTPVTILCKKHGEFKTRPDGHLNGRGCPKCSLSSRTSKVEKRVTKWIRKLGIDYVENDRSILDGKEIDIYLPKYKIGIEIHGIYFHREEKLGRDYHKHKMELAQKKGVHLLQFWEHDIYNNLKIVKSMIRHKLNLSRRFYARELECKKITDYGVVCEFLNKNHLQGQCSFSVAYGLFLDTTLVSVMTFQKSRFNKKYDWELIRYATKRKYQVVGGASKLLTNFKRNYKGSIISYADCMHSEGNVYSSLGFELVSKTQPNYFYFKGLNILSRYKCQKHKLEKLLPVFDPNLTEKENMEINGYKRVYDAGHLVYVLK